MIQAYDDTYDVHRSFLPTTIFIKQERLDLKLEISNDSSYRKLNDFENMHLSYFNIWIMLKYHNK